MEPTVGDSTMSMYGRSCERRYYYEISRSTYESLPNPRAGLSPPAVGELSSTSNSFKHSKRSSKLCVSGTAIVADLKGAWQTMTLTLKVKVQRSIIVFALAVMSRQFRKAYEYARACAQGSPPYPKKRIYLCNWYVKLVKPGKEIPSNQVQCHVPMK